MYRSIFLGAWAHPTPNNASLVALLPHLDRILTFHQHQQMTSTMKEFFPFYHFTPCSDSLNRNYRI